MSAPTARQQFVDLIRPFVPARQWALKPHELDGEAIDRPVLIVSQQTIQRHPNLPMSKLLVSFTIRLAVPSQDIATREDELDEAMTSLLYGLNELQAVSWTDANKALAERRYLAYDVTATMIVEQPARPTPNTIAKRKRA